MTYGEAVIVLACLPIVPERQRQALNLALELLEKEAKKCEEADTVEVKDI